MIGKPDIDGYFNYAKINNDKLKMFDSLCNLFSVSIGENFIDNLNDLVAAIKRHVTCLPSIIIKSSLKDNLLKLNQNELAFKNLVMKLNINNYEFIFEELPRVFKVSFNGVARNVSNALTTLSNKQKTRAYV